MLQLAMLFAEKVSESQQGQQHQQGQQPPDPEIPDLQLREVPLELGI
jgi:hypothetical protein